MLAEAAVRHSLMCSLIVRNPTPLSSVAQYVDLPDYSCTCFTTSPIDQQRSSTNELVAPLKRAPQAIPTYERKFYGTVKVSFQSQTGSTGHSDGTFSPADPLAFALQWHFSTRVFSQEFSPDQHDGEQRADDPLVTRGLFPGIFLGTANTSCPSRADVTR